MAALFLIVLVLASALPGLAWDVAPHRAITKAALDAVEPSVARRLAPHTKDLLETYVLLPDRCRDFTEQPDAVELKPFCLRPDGNTVHSATFDPDEDLGSLVYLYERILTAESTKKEKELAMYVGVLAHFIEDSLSPPHSITGEELEEMAPEIKWIHQKLERAVPAFAIERRKPQVGAANMFELLESFVVRLHEAAARNRGALPGMIAALKAGDEKALDPVRLRAAKDTAELLADTLNAMLGGQPN